MTENRPIKFCTCCGNQLYPPQAEICPGCGSLVGPSPSGPVGKLKLLLVTLLLGGVGGHKFYLGRHGQGLLCLLFCWTGIPLVIALVELILYAAKSEDALRRRYPVVSPAGLKFAVVISVLLVGMVILFALLVSQMNAFRQRGFDNTACSEVRRMQTCFDAYRADEGHYPRTLEEINHCHCADLSAGVKAFVLPDEENYRLLCYHQRGAKAYLTTHETAPRAMARKEAERELITRFRIVEKAGNLALLAR